MASEADNLDRRSDAATPAGVGARIVARVIDAVVLGVVGTAFGPLFDFGLAWLGLQALLVFAYFVVLDVTVGTTLGKRLLGLRVTGPDGGTPTVGQAAIREAFTLLGAIPYAGPFLALLAWVVIIVSINASVTGQGKHDELAGGTRVVKP